LVDRAVHIVCEVWTDSAGVSPELFISRKAGRCEDTLVLILSPADGGLRLLETFEGFWRVILVKDLEAREVWEHERLRLEQDRSRSSANVSGLEV